MTFSKFRSNHYSVRRPVKKTYTIANGKQYPNYRVEYTCLDCNATMTEIETISNDGNSYDYRVEYTT